MNDYPEAGRPEPVTPTFEAYGGSAPENYERYFVPVIGEPLAEQLLGLAALQPGERVVDVACGTGVLARRAVERVGPDGSVTGVDVNPGMLAVAGAVCPEGIEWREASAEELPLPDDTYDVALCQMGLQFFEDRPAALSEMRRVLAPGGRLVANLPGPEPEIFAIFGERLARHIAPQLEGFVAAVFALHDEAELEELLADAGFGEVSARSTRRILRLPAPAQFLWQYVHSTPLVAGLGEADADARAALERDVVAAWEPFTEDGALKLEVGVTQVVGRNA